MAEPVDAAREKRIGVLWGFGAVIGALVLIMLWLLLFMLQAGGNARLLAVEGREVVAEVTDRRVVETRRTDSENRAYTETTHFVTVRFDTPSRRNVPVEVQVDEARHAALAPGQRVPLRYAASDPRVVEFAAGEAAREVLFLRWVVLGLGLVAAGLTVLAVRQYRAA